MNKYAADGTSHRLEFLVLYFDEQKMVTFWNLFNYLWAKYDSVTSESDCHYYRLVIVYN